MSGAEISIDPKDSRSTTVLDSTPLLTFYILSTPFIHWQLLRGSSGEREREKNRKKKREREAEGHLSLSTRALRTYAGKHLQCSFGAGGIKEINYPATHTSSAPDPHSPPNLAHSPLFPYYYEDCTKHSRPLQASIFSEVPPLASHIFILYCPYSTRPSQASGWNSLSSCSPTAMRISVYFFHWMLN